MASVEVEDVVRIEVVTLEHIITSETSETSERFEPVDYAALKRNRKVVNSNCLKIYTKICENYTEGKYTDLNIVIEDRLFPCHRLVLGSASKYFDSILSQNLEENVPLTTMDASIFEEILRYIYQGNILVNDANVFDLLCASDIVEIKFIEEKCLRYLSECKIPEDQAIQLFEYACVTQRRALKDTVGRWILEQIEFFSKKEVFLNLLHEFFVALLTYWRPSSSVRERKLLDAIFQWVSYSSEGNQTVYEELAQSVGFRHISNEIETYWRSNIATVDGDTADDEPNSSSPSVNTTLHVYINTHVSYYDNYDGEDRPYQERRTSLCTFKKTLSDVDWIPSPIEPTIDFMRTVAFENRLYCLKKVSGVYSFSVNSSTDLLAAGETFLQMPPQPASRPSNRFYSRATQYLMSGSVNQIYICDSSHNFYKYNIDNDQWFPIPIVLWNKAWKTTPLCICSTDDGRLFVIGSYKSNNRWGKGRHFYAYDPRAGKWDILLFFQCSS